MNRFLALILGAVLCGAAPLHAQQASPSAPDRAAALLQKAQEAAAQGDAQRASEYARAAAELYAAQPRAGDPAVVAAVRSRAAQEHAAQEHAAQAHAEARAHAEAQERASARAVERADAAAFAGEIPHLEEVFMRERAPAEGEAPPARITRWRQAAPGAGDAPPPMAFAMPADPRAQERGHAGPAPAPRAQHPDELGMTLRLIHAEVQALRAEVQALRAEMTLMRMPGGAHGASAPSSRSGAMFGSPEHTERLHGMMAEGFWAPAAQDGDRRVIIVRPDGKRYEDADGEFKIGGVWTTEPGSSDAAEIELRLEQLNELGYVDTVGQPSPALPVPAVPATPATPAVPRTPRR